MKKILIIGLVFILSFGLIGCGEDDNGNGDDSSVVWEEYSNDLMAISYPEQWEYEEDDGAGVMFFEEGEKIEELDYFVQIYVEEYDETTEEEFWKKIEKVIAEIKDEARESEGLDFISDTEINIDDQEAIELVYNRDIVYSFIVPELTYDLKLLSENLKEDNFEKYAEKIENYKADGTQEFIDNTTLEDLEELKKLLLEIKEEDSADYNYIDNMIDYINDILDEGSLERWEKSKETFTFHNGYQISLGYINIEENYDNKIGIVNHMIDSIKLLD